MLEDFRLKIFVTVAETGSFTKTALRLGISQPAVSQNISSIEKSLGTVLFDRAASALTPQGHLFMDYATRIISAYEEADILFRYPSETSPVSIFADREASVHVLQDILTVLRTAHPDGDFRTASSAEEADIRIVTTVYNRSGLRICSFRIFPEDHPLSPVIGSIIAGEQTAR